MSLGVLVLISSLYGLLLRCVCLFLFSLNSHFILGRVTSKTVVRSYGSGDGRVFNFVVMDDSASVLVKAFNRNCDRVFGSIVLGGVSFNRYVKVRGLYLIVIIYFQMIKLSAFSVTIANKRYSSLAGDYEIVIGTESRFDVVHDEPAVVIRPSFEFRSVDEFQSLAIDGLYGKILLNGTFETRFIGCGQIRLV